jgi:hypothetical protein
MRNLVERIEAAFTGSSIGAERTQAPRRTPRHGRRGELRRLCEPALQALTLSVRHPLCPDSSLDKGF